MSFVTFCKNISINDIDQVGGKSLVKTGKIFLN